MSKKCEIRRSGTLGNHGVSFKAVQKSLCPSLKNGSSSYSPSLMGPLGCPGVPGNTFDGLWLHRWILEERFDDFIRGLEVYVCKLLGRPSLIGVLKVSRTLLTLQRYSGQWAPLPSELSSTSTCSQVFRKALACPDSCKVYPVGW